MIAASWPGSDPRGDRLLVIDPNERAAKLRHARVAELALLLDPGDVVVVNDSATLPASIAARLDDAPVEMRLVARGGSDAEWTALLFGAGDFRTRTEDRAPPPVVRAGDRLIVGVDFAAVVLAVHDDWRGRLVDLCFDAREDRDDRAALWSQLYRYGRPIQYAHTSRAFALWDVQNVFSGPPWSVESPSAGRVLRARELDACRRRGIRLATLTHAAGLSSTGVAELDARLPLPERSSIPEVTVRTVNEARAARHRVVAVGTTVLRALEGRVAQVGELVAGEGITDLVVTRAQRRHVVTSLLTGLHEEGTSHFQVLESFVERSVLAPALRAAEDAGYRSHELGDAMLVL